MSYLGRIDMTRSDKMKAEENFPPSEQGYAIGKLLDGIECQILLDSRGTKSVISKTHYLRCKSLHSSPKFASKSTNIQVGNGQNVCVLFIIPVILDIHGNRFEKFTFMSEIHEILLVLDISNIYELKGRINLRVMF